MRVAKLSRTILLLALPLVPAACAWAQEHPNVQPNAVRNQLTQGLAAAQAPQSGAPATPPPAGAKAPSKKPMAPGKAPAKAPQAPPATAAANGKAPEKPATEKPAGSRRDPFETLLSNTRPANATPENLPPGKAGLVVGTLRIDGIVRGGTGVIAVVSNPQQRVYFLREGDKLYDGSVEHITLEAITFQEVGKDAFGKPVEHEVTKRLYPSPGEQQ